MNPITKKLALFGSVAVVLLSIFLYDRYTPKSYEDCILLNIDKGANPQAVLMIQRTCRDKFPNVFEQFNH